MRFSLRFPLNPFFHAGIGISALLLIIIFTLVLGSIPFSEAWESMLLQLSGKISVWNPILDDRLPRLIVLFFTGASLATAGATMQALFQTPLATPSILGTSAGGSLMMAPFILMQWQISLPYILPLAAIAGCFLSLFIVYGLSRGRGDLSTAGLLLTGIAVSSLLFSIEGAMNYAFRTHWQQMQLLSELSSGSSANIGWLQAHLLLPLSLVGLFGCQYYAWELDLLSLGDEEALSLGVDLNKVRFRLFLCIALLTGASIASIGNIAFFGLLIPCVLRIIYKANHRLLIPLCIFWGGIALCAIDLFLRFFALNALTIGHISALCGSLLFLGMLLSNQKS